MNQLINVAITMEMSKPGRRGSQRLKAIIKSKVPTPMSKLGQWDSPTLLTMMRTLKMGLSLCLGSWKNLGTWVAAMVRPAAAVKPARTGWLMRATSAVPRTNPMPMRNTPTITASTAAKAR